jgi:hypothetical protein
MLPYNGKFDEYAQLYAQLGQVTIMDLIKNFNDKKDNDDRHKLDIIDLKIQVNLLMQLQGHHYTHTLQEAVSEKNRNTILQDNKPFLKMDRSGNIWLNGVLENNPNRIGKEIVKIAQQYRENLPIEKLSEFLNEPIDSPF